MVGAGISVYELDSIKFNELVPEIETDPGIYFSYSAALPGMYLSPYMYMSPALYVTRFAKTRHNGAY